MWCKTEFSGSLLQSSVSHDPSEIILICWFVVQEIFPIINNVENSFDVIFFVETFPHFFSGFLINGKFKRKAFI